MHRTIRPLFVEFLHTHRSRTGIDRRLPCQAHLLSVARPRGSILTSRWVESCLRPLYQPNPSLCRIAAYQVCVCLKLRMRPSCPFQGLQAAAHNAQVNPVLISTWAMRSHHGPLCSPQFSRYVFLRGLGILGVAAICPLNPPKPTQRNRLLLRAQGNLYSRQSNHHRGMGQN